MIIRTLHIDRFGGLRDRTLNLNAGVNVFFGPNESGKSSAAGFVKFMLYGLPSREKAVNPEKSRALDRETGSASGWMKIRADDGAEYRLERTASPGDTGAVKDRVRIVNEKTGEITEGVNPGEFFFGVPEEVYASSAFVRQGAIRPGTPDHPSSGGMRGAVENLLTSADEAVDLRRASESLEERRKSLSGKNGGGEIAALAEKRAALLAERNSTAARTAEALSLSVSLDDIRRRIAELEANRARYEGIFDSLEKITVKRRIDAADETESQLKKVRAALAALNPGGDTFSADDSFDDLLNEAEREIRTYEEERIAFRERFPGERDFPSKLRPYPFSSDNSSDEDEATRLIPDLPEDGPIPAASLSELTEDGMVEPYEDTGALAMEGELVTDGGDDSLPDPHEAIETAKHLSKVTKWEFFAGIFFACLALLGLGLSIGLSGTDISPVPALIATLVLMTLSLTTVVAHVLSSSRLNALLAEWNAESADEIEIAVQEHLIAVERKTAGEKERKRLSASLESARVRRNAAAARINELADRVGISPRQDIHETLRLLRKKTNSEASDRRQLSARRSQLEGRLEVLREQLGEVDVSAAELDAHAALGTVWGREAASLNGQQIKDLTRERDFTESALRSAELRRASLEEKLAEIGKITRTADELDTMIEAADERLEELTLRRDALELASSALKKAGESVRQGIIPRIAQAASRRVSEVSGDWDRMLLDDRLSCSLASDDAVLPSELLSRGTADLSFLSLRLALTGELFRGERPPVILDESFAHMDADRTARFLATLTESPAPAQTLVFTCRSDEADAARELGCPVIEL
ncbi:MAG: hypothetical protein E7576_17635 [Ruminococcaceae bacterium]|jgi:predicted nuclease with TOPRIM domain|nr:hypothetical protein [Oscillospiraceae bacterium]